MRGSARYGVELPFTGDALEGVGASLGEDEPRPRDKIDDSPGDEHFARPGEILHPAPDVNGDVTDPAGQVDRVERSFAQDLMQRNRPRRACTASAGQRLRAHRVQRPLPDALQIVFASILELEPGAGYEIGD